MSYTNKTSVIGYLLENLNDLDTDLSKRLDNLLNKTFGILLTFLSNELTAQQRQIWLALAQFYPEPKSGSELAEITGSSKVSKSVYQSIEGLKRKKLIIVHQLHPRSYAIQANSEHPLTAVLIEYCTYYGNKGI